MHAHAALIDPGLTFQPVNTHHLIGHFNRPAVAENGTFEIQSPIG
ncbi:hypothetical protein SDC9_53210 [bioreactor metagenome]|uniref:Uncharacterized protein n=1 Tax=bioreactor metagenome TaxID=1076179 RepID=A0A644WTA2_9ZZZZ